MLLETLLIPPMPNIFNPTSFNSLFKNLEEKMFKDIVHTKTVYPYNLYQILNDDGDVISSVLEFALAGKSKEQINITTKDDRLYINVTEDKLSHYPEKRSYLHNGIAARSMSSEWQMSTYVDVGKIESKFVDGILSITLPPKNPEINTLKAVDIKIS